MALKVGELFASLSLKDADFQKGLSGAQSAFQNFGKTLASLGVTAALVKIGKTAFESAVSFESAFAGVRKTTEATEAEFAQLSQSIIDMSKSIPATAVSIAGVAEAAGQLGIHKNDLMSFTRVMIDLGESTDLSAGEAATTLAKFANVVGMSAEHYSNLGSAIVGLGNNFATTESDIAAIAMRLAGAGATVGMSEADMLGFAAAISSIGMEAQAGGSAMSVFSSRMALAVSGGGKDLKKFAKVAGMSTKDFKKLFQEDATGAIQAFVKGLQGAEDPLKVLSDMGLDDINLQRLLTGLANGGDLLANALETANTEWEKNTALSEEAAKRYATMESRLAMMQNSLTEAGRSLGEVMLPVMEKVVGAVAKGADWFSGLSEGVRQALVAVGALAAGAGPLKMVLGGVFKVLGSGLGVFKVLLGPIGWVAAGLALLYKYCKPVQNAVKKLGSFFRVFFNMLGDGKDVLKAARTALVMAFGGDAYKQVMGALDTMREAWDKSVKWIQDTADGARRAFERGSREGGIFGGIAESARYLGPRVGDMLKQGWAGITTIARNLGGKALSALGGALQKTEHFKGLGKKLVEAALALGEGESIDFAGLLDAFKTGVISWRDETLIPWFEGIDWGAAWTAFWKVMTDVGVWLKDTAIRFGALLNTLVSKIREWRDAILVPWLQSFDWSGAWMAFWNVLTDISTWIKTDAAEGTGFIVGKLAVWLTGLGGAVIEKLKELLKPGEGESFTAADFWEIVMGAVNWAETFAENFLTGIYNGFTGKSFNWNQVKNALDTGFDDFVASALEWGREIGDGIINGIKGKINELFAALGLGEPFEIPVEVTPEIYSGGGGGLEPELFTPESGGGRKAGAQDANEYLDGASDALKSSTLPRDAWDNGLLGDVSGESMSLGTEGGSAFAGAYGDALSAAQDATSDAASGLGSAALDGAKTETDGSTGIGKDFSSGLANGILDGKSGVVNAATEVAKAAAQAAKNTLDIGSPSKLMRRYGGFTSKGLALGLMDGLRVVTQSASSVARAAANALSIDPARGSRAFLRQLSPGGAASGGVDLVRLAPLLADAMTQRPAYFDVNGRRIAEATTSDNRRALGLRARRIAFGYGGQ